MRSPRLILSTVGTSMLYHVLTDQEKAEKWGDRLTAAANLREADMPADVRNKVKELAARAFDQLGRSDNAGRRRLSAELNGIYGLYKGNPDEMAPQDMHVLVATDTCQGASTAKVLRDFLAGLKMQAQIYTPASLSTASTKMFSSGIKDLIGWCETTIPGYRSAGYRVIFNLVGSFKALQGYMTTISMFYADESVYIFEGSNMLINIPRLPVEIKYDCLEPFAAWLAMMEQGYVCEMKHLEGLPTIMLDNEGHLAGLSDWGLLIWQRCKERLLTAEAPITYPRLAYEESFRRDYRNADKNERLQLNVDLAKAAKILEEKKGDLTGLKGNHGLCYENYEDCFDKGKPVAHFRVGRAMRVSCQYREEGALTLRRFGRENEVNYWETRR